MAIDTTDYNNQRFLPPSVEDKLVGLIGRSAGAVMLLFIAFVWLSLATWTTRDPSLTLATSGPVHNLGGAPGAIIADLMLQMLGFASVAALLAPMFWCVELISARQVMSFRSKIAFYPLSVLVIAGALSALPASASWPVEHGYGGILGDFVFGLVAGFFALLNPARAGAATGLVLAAIGASTLMHSIGLEIKDLYRILFQPIHRVNWRETAGSWQHSLLSEAQRLRDGVRDTLETDWSSDEGETSKSDQKASAEEKSQKNTPHLDADVSPHAPSPRIIMAGTTQQRATSAPPRLISPTITAPQRSAPAPMPQRMMAYPAAPQRRHIAAPHVPQSGLAMAPQSPAMHPGQMGLLAGLRPVPPNPILQRVPPMASTPQRPAPPAPVAAGQAKSRPVLPPTTPHPVSNPFDGQQNRQQAVSTKAQQSAPSFAAPKVAPTEQALKQYPKPSAPTQKQTPQSTIAEQFAAHIAHESSTSVDEDLDDEDKTSRAIARRFAPASAGVVPDHENSNPASQDRQSLPATADTVTDNPQTTTPPSGTAMPPLMKTTASGTRKNRHILPSTKLLARAEAPQMMPDQSPDVLRKNAQDLQTVLADFGVKGAVKNIRPGPVVTLYEFEPARGIKSSRVIGLADDIARSMSAISARVAVVPGRNVIGIELPNAERRPVLLRELLDANAYRSSTAALPLTLGKSIGGEPIIADLARMPHLLVAGTTGSGKSVGVNAMVLSILFKHTPEACRLLMIDPKMLELSVYNDIPHLLSPVITDPQKAVVALNWAVREMEERYKRMSKLSVRNIGVYNNRVRNAQKRGERLSRTVHTGFDASGQATYEEQTMDLEELPHIVIVVDEFADLMLVAGKEIEAAIQRLAQMARAAGIHLIMATQRPSVDVITGTIKANFPTRISFKVTSKVDSRTILNEQGAEQLLGQGDMLYASGSGQTLRVHGPFVSDEEVEAIANHLKDQGAPAYVADVTEEPSAPEDQGPGKASSNEDIYDQALAIVLRDRKASTSYIQRRLSIGYNRAADLIERMEQDGVIGPAGSGGKREILLPAATSKPSENAA